MLSITISEAPLVDALAGTNDDDDTFYHDALYCASSARLYIFHSELPHRPRHTATAACTHVMAAARATEQRKIWGRRAALQLQSATAAATHLNPGSAPWHQWPQRPQPWRRWPPGRPAPSHTRLRNAVDVVIRQPLGTATSRSKSCSQLFREPHGPHTRVPPRSAAQ